MLEDTDLLLDLQLRHVRDYVQQDIRAPLDPLTNMEELLHLVLVLVLVVVYALVVIMHKGGQHLVLSVLLERIQ
jgi:hypothetical protein